ncbi:unnamed protein product [Effrenium voratum]|uniref:Uncharacterized protein n=1 Tax=Effrenium voratum TaxID=2562239 RepID=A0AA36J5J3_9DINO|nr:unnamed protein product [Effrenium voratum]
MYVKIVGREVPFPLVLVGNSVGPRVVVDPPSLDFGGVKCLEPVTRHVRLTNFSCIDASVRAFMNERKSLWSVHPKVIHLSPQEHASTGTHRANGRDLPSRGHVEPHRQRGG